MKKNRPIFWLLLLLLFQASCGGQPVEKINGVSFVGSREAASQPHVDAVLKRTAQLADGWFPNYRQALQAWTSLEKLDHYRLAGVLLLDQ